MTKSPRKPRKPRTPKIRPGVGSLDLRPGSQRQSYHYIRDTGSPQWQEALRKMDERERLKRQNASVSQQPGQRSGGMEIDRARNNDDGSDDFYDGPDYTDINDDQSNFGVPNMFNIANRKAKKFYALWDRESSRIKEWLTEALSSGSPDPKLSTPNTLPSLQCNCTKQKSKVTVYMLHNGNFLFRQYLSQFLIHST